MSAVAALMRTPHRAFFWHLPVSCRCRRSLLRIACLLAAVMAPFAPIAPIASAADLALGKAVGSFRIRTLAGRELTPANTSGRVLVVNLWATWCPPCREELPAIDAFYRRYRERGVEVVAVSMDDLDAQDAVRKVLAPYALTAAFALQSDLRAFGRLRHLPATFVIDRQGILRRDGWAEPGAVDVAALEHAVLPLLAEHPR